MEFLTNSRMPYQWGKRGAISRLLGASESHEIEAELWLGAHPLASSKLKKNEISLLSLIEANPERELGTLVSKKFEQKLPFLLKILAAESPLSLQAHPNKEYAKKAFAKEEALGISLESPLRNYKDPNAKPELLCALTPFWALCGFKKYEHFYETLSHLNLLSLDLLSWLPPPKQETEDALLKFVFTRLMSLSPEDSKKLCEKTYESLLHINLDSFSSESDPFLRTVFWAKKLSEKYPGDIGVFCSLMLHVLYLKPLEAIYLDAGHLHAYLDGVGIEIMASSDNVLRGGLTPKHVDVPELLQVLHFSPLPPSILPASREGQLRVFHTKAAEFELSFGEKLDSLLFTPNGPEILLCLEGSYTLTTSDKTETQLQKGDSLWISGTEKPFLMHGNGLFFRASVGSFHP